MPQASGFGVVKGPLSLEDDFVQKRAYDKSRIPVVLTRFDSPFPHLLLENQAKKKQCTDVEVKIFEQDEFPFAIRVTAVAGDPNSIDIHNDDIGLIQPEDMLTNSHIQYSYDEGTDTATYVKATAANLQATVFTPEIVRVVSINGPGAASHTRVSIERQHTLDGAATVVDIATALWDSETLGADNHNIRRMYKSNFDGGDAGEAVSKNLGVVTNYLGKIEREVELTDWQLAVEQFGEQNPWLRVKQQGMETYMREVSNMFLFSRGKKWTNNGKLQQRTHGLVDLITAPSRRQIADYKVSALNAALEPIINVGKRGDRYWICGGTFLRKFTDIVEEKSVYNDPEMKKMLGVSLTTFKDFKGGLHHLTVDREMDESPLWSNRAFVVNFEYLKYGFLKGEDIRLWMGASGKGIQNNSSPNLKGQMRATCGLLSTFRGSATEPSAQGMLIMPN